MAQERYDEAAVECDEALSLSTRRGDRLRRAESLKLRARIERVRRDYDAVIGSLAEASALAREVEDHILEAELLCELGEVWQLRGDSAIADAVLTEAVDTFTRAGAGRAASEAASHLSIERQRETRAGA
jgi:tetratricopeptide (TPR) repeat protein